MTQDNLWHDSPVRFSFEERYTIHYKMIVAISINIMILNVYVFTI